MVPPPLAKIPSSPFSQIEQPEIDPNVLIVIPSSALSEAVHALTVHPVPHAIPCRVVPPAFVPFPFAAHAFTVPHRAPTGIASE